MIDYKWLLIDIHNIFRTRSYNCWLQMIIDSHSNGDFPYVNIQTMNKHSEFP